MTDVTVNAWFDQGNLSLFSFVALISVLYVLERYAERGQHRWAVLSACTAVLLVGIGFLVAASLAHQQAQPRYVYTALGLCGAVIVIASTFGLARLIYLYRGAGRALSAEHQQRHTFNS